MSSLAAQAFGRYKAFWFLDAPNWVGSVELYGALIPTLVTFGKLDEPTSARVVAATDAAFTREIGPGYSLHRVMIEMVPPGAWPLNRLGQWGTPVTRGIERRCRGGDNRAGLLKRRGEHGWQARHAVHSVEPEIIFTR